MDPYANEYIARLTRELEEARERARAITTAARRVVETAYPPSGGFQRVHRSAIEDLRRAVGADPGDRSERQWELDPPSVAHLIRLEVGRTGQSSYPEIEGLLRTAADQLDYLARELEAVRAEVAACRAGASREAFTREMIEAVRFASGLFAAGEWGPLLAQAAERMAPFLGVELPDGDGIVAVEGPEKSAAPGKISDRNFSGAEHGADGRSKAQGMDAQRDPLALELRGVISDLALCLAALEGRDGADVATELAIAQRRLRDIEARFVRRWGEGGV
jgi:hypothetical protein